MRNVYIDSKGELSFEHVQNENVCVGETDGTLEDWKAWHEQQVKEREKNDI